MIEKYFKQYNEFKTKIRLLEIEIDDSIGVGGKSTDAPLSGRISVKNNVSPVERQVDHISSIQDEIRQLRRMIEKIDIVMDTLDDESKTLIKLRYFENASITDIASQYNLTKQAVYERFKILFKSLEKYCTYILK